MSCHKTVLVSETENVQGGSHEETSVINLFVTLKVRRQKQMTYRDEMTSVIVCYQKPLSASMNESLSMYTVDKLLKPDNTPRNLTKGHQGFSFDTVRKTHVIFLVDHDNMGYLLEMDPKGSLTDEKKLEVPVIYAGVYTNELLVYCEGEILKWADSGTVDFSIQRDPEQIRSNDSAATHIVYQPATNQQALQDELLGLVKSYYELTAVGVSTENSPE